MSPFWLHVAGGPSQAGGKAGAGEGERIAWTCVKEGGGGKQRSDSGLLLEIEKSCVLRDGSVVGVEARQASSA